MIISTILLVTTVSLILLSLFSIKKSRDFYIKSKTEIESLQKVIDDNIKLSGQLYKLYAALQDSQSLQIKAFEALSKTQKIASADIIELRDQVSQALVAIVEQISGGTSSVETVKIKDGKFRLN
jgi:hypothetical protein